MIKRFLITIIISAALIYTILFTKFDNVLTLKNFLDSMFVVGMVMLFSGIIVATNITQVFQGFVYSFRNMFLKKSKHLSFYDYHEDKISDKDKSTGIPMLFVGASYFIASIIIAYVYFL